jgi:hypothetical protein
MVTAHLLLNGATVLRHHKGANDRACCTAEKAVTGYFLSPIGNKRTLTPSQISAYYLFNLFIINGLHFIIKVAIRIRY